MINLDQELQNYPAIDLKIISENNTNISDNVRNSIILYNKALDSLRQNSEDIAIIELKKAIAMNPDFHEAMNLLGLCYSYTKEYSKAINIFEKVIAAENNSVQAMKYLGLLNAGNTQTATDSKLKSGLKNRTRKINEKRLSLTEGAQNMKIGWSADIPKYLTGLVAGVVGVLLVTLVINLASGKPADTPADMSDMPQIAAEDSSDYKMKYESLSKEYDKVKDELGKANTEANYYKSVVQLLEVDKLVQNNSYEAAADLLVLLKSVGFKGAEKERFENLYNSVLPKAASVLLTEGTRLEKSKKYQEAINKLNKVLIYGNDWKFTDRVLYSMGKSYMGLNDSANAIDIFQQIKDKFPGSKYAKYADGWIKSLTGSL
ncbi:MAG: tetratricopeptide repeat protein [Clostridia bacterium]|nr:tetratricopeptide repeat protein [Clostridia bacterium]